MKNRKYPVANLGTALILTIFIILALVTFATLSVVNAANDFRFTQKLSDRVTDYYAAASEAEKKLDSIDHILEATYKESPDTYPSAAVARLEEVKGVAVLEKDGKTLLMYVIPINGKQNLQVELELTDPAASAGYYKINSWQEIMNQEWDGDDKLNVM